MIPDIIPQKYEDWDEIVTRLEADVQKARDTSVGVAIAIECQSYNLAYCKKRRDSFPKPIISKDDANKDIIMENEKPEEKKPEQELDVDEAAKE